MVDRIMLVVQYLKIGIFRECNIYLTIFCGSIWLLLRLQKVKGIFVHLNTPYQHLSEHDINLIAIHTCHIKVF